MVNFELKRPILFVFLKILEEAQTIFPLFNKLTKGCNSRPRYEGSDSHVWREICDTELRAHL